jgi:hypothetical protein
MKNKKWRGILWRWHRQLGVVFFVFVVWLSVTGILLNHTDDFSLAEQPVHQTLLLKLYGIERPLVRSYHISEQWISHSGEQLYLNGVSFTHCLGEFNGIGYGTLASENSTLTPENSTLAAAACGKEIVLFTLEGDLVERLSDRHELPQPIVALGQCEQPNNSVSSICFSTGSAQFSLNLDMTTWASTTVKVKQYSAQQMPKTIQTLVEKNSVTLNWERVVLDLHAGRIFGLGPWLMDIVAVFFILLGVSGITVWLLSRKR